MGLRMRTMTIAVAAGLLLAGCTPTSDVSQSGAVDLQGFETVSWPELNGYCTFHAADHAFDPADEATWRFIFVKPYTPTGRDAWGVIGLDGERLTLSETSFGTFSRRYQVIDRPEIEIEVTMVAAGLQNGPGAYAGELRRLAPEPGPPITILGNCVSW